MASEKLWSVNTDDVTENRPNAARLAAIALVLAIMVLDAATLRGLYADGAPFLVHMLAARTFSHVNFSRWIAEFLTQFPVVAALRLGVTNLQVLLLVQSSSLVVVPGLFWVIALIRFLRDDTFWSLFVLFCIVYFNVGFFVIGEFNVAYSLAALSMAILASRSDIGPIWAVVALIAAICLLAAYEAMVFLGPLLAVMAVVRMWAQRPPPIVKWLLILCVVCYLAAACVAGFSILNPRDPDSFYDAISLWTATANLSLALSVLFAVGCYVSLASVKSVRRRGHLIALFCLLAILWPGCWSIPNQHYQARTLVGMIIFGYGGILAARWVIDRRFPFQIGRIYRLTAAYPLILFLALSVADVAHSLQFARYVEHFRAEVDSRTGLVPLEETKLLAGDDALYGWGWTYPSMSLLLRHDERRGIILNARGFKGYQPFDPQGTVPDLRAYYSAGNVD